MLQKKSGRLLCSSKDSRVGAALGNARIPLFELLIFWRISKHANSQPIEKALSPYLCPLHFSNFAEKLSQGHRLLEIEATSLRFT
jgi:hypothetical protein